MDTDLDIAVKCGKALSRGELEAVLQLFDQSYGQANHNYLLKSFDVMRFIALAWDKGALAGFAVGDAMSVELPRMDGPQVVAMAGIACIDADHRRGGLFGRLALASIEKSGLMEGNARHLFCGRMAHPVSYRAMVRSSNNTVPFAGQPISEWQQEVIERVAGLYKSDVDPDTSRIIGKGAPIGYPVLEYEATRQEAEVFEGVDRDKGDSILAMSWRPTPPDGWLASD